MTKMHEDAVALLTAIWRGIPSGYKSYYRRSIWQQFENAVRSAAYTGNLSKFFNSICSKLQVQIRSGDCATVESILNGGSDRAILRLLREETTLLTLMVRVANQARKDEFEAELAAMESENFGLPIDHQQEEN